MDEKQKRKADRECGERSWTKGDDIRTPRSREATRSGSHDDEKQWDRVGKEGRKGQIDKGKLRCAWREESRSYQSG